MAPILYFALVCFSTLWAVLGVWALWRVRRRHEAHARTPSVSVLKPLCGADDSLEDNLRTFFEQDYPQFELVFGVQGTADPAATVVRRLRAQYPRVPCRLVTHEGGRGVNPKVSNLRAMLGAVQHDLVVISDSNVAVAPSYLRNMAARMDEPGAGLVVSPFAGVGERSIGATLENLHLNGEVAAGMAAPTELFGHPVSVGKSMMFRRSVFERLGGFASVACVLAEDYVIGRMFHEAGYAVLLASEPVHNVCTTVDVKGFVRRHVRWGMLRVRLQPFAYLLEPVAKPTIIALIAPLFGVWGAAPLIWAVGLTVARDSIQWVMLRGSSGLLRALPFFALRDALTFIAWLVAPFRRHVSWRGNRVRVSAGTRLYAEHAPRPPVPPRVSVQPVGDTPLV